MKSIFCLNFFVRCPIWEEVMRDAVLIQDLCDKCKDRHKKTHNFKVIMCCENTCSAVQSTFKILNKVGHIGLDKRLTKSSILSATKSMIMMGMKRSTGGVTVSRAYSAGGKGGKKGPKGGGAAAGDNQQTSIVSKEVKATTVVSANILKDGPDPKILSDSEYPDWLFRILDKRPTLRELEKVKKETLPFDHLRRLAKLDNRRRIKENNTTKAKH